MKRYLIIIIACFIAANASAQEEQRIRDYSLPPSESLRLPDVTHNGNPYSQFPGQGGFGAMGNNGQNGGAAFTPANRFMDGYCDPNSSPLIAGNDKIAAMQSCLAQQKQRQCATFNSLPADAQRVIDDTANCLFTASNADPETTKKAPDCSANDSLRFQLIRKYGQNQAVAQALESLPEDVINAANKCVRGGR